MAKNKRERITNPNPFLNDDDNDTVSRTSTKSRSKPPKNHQKQQKLISSGMSSKILKEALIQQREVQEEEAALQNPSGVSAAAAFSSVAEEQVRETEEEIDEFAGFDDTRSQGNFDEEIDEEDDKLLDAFFSKDAGMQKTLADVVEKIKGQGGNVNTSEVPKIDNSVIDLYTGVGKYMNKYTAGKLPKAFKHIPAMPLWEEVLYLTKPESWSPNAMYQATRIFASNLGIKKAERFYKLVLLPRIREDIRKNKRLHFALFQSLKKSLYKPAAFFKGILFPLCESRTCSLREAVIVGSVIQKVSIPPLHSSVGLLKLAEMEYCGTTSYFLKLLVEKKYALPYRVLDALVAHFMQFLEDSRMMPVIWHQSLLAFVQRYKSELRKEDKDNLRTLIDQQKHYLVTPEIARELDNSRNRGEKDDDAMIITPISVINKTIEEDRFDILDVPMEED